MGLSSEFAALTTFRKFCNEGKDIYDVIQEFILFILVDEAYSVFDAVRIKEDVNTEFALNVPLSVIKEALKRLLKNGFIKKEIEEGFLCCIIQELFDEIEQNIKEYREEKKIHNYIKKNLIEYVKRRAPHRGYSEELIFNVFRSLILGNDDLPIDESKLIKIVGTFILKQTNDNPLFSTSWDLVKSSIIIKEGLLYNSDIISQKIKHLTIYLDMEILFDGEGYNGTVYKNLFTTFFDYIECLKDKGCQIELKYFEETHNEIDFYFKKALEIFDNRGSMYPETTAMIDIVSGCKNRTDIIEKKEKFFHFIDKKNISIDYTNIYKKEKHKYPLRRDINGSGTTTENHNETLFPLEYIKTLKRGKIDHKLTETNYIFATRTSHLLRISKNERTHKDEISLAVNTDYLINNFWVISGDGLGGNAGFTNTVSYVQRILSEEKRKEIIDEYKKLKNEEGSQDPELIRKKVLALKAIENKPEQMTSTSFDYDDIDEEINDLLKSKETLSEVRSEHKKVQRNLEVQVKETSKIIKEKVKIEEENSSLKNIIIKQRRNLQKEIDALYLNKQAIDDDANLIKNKWIHRIKIYSLLFMILSDIFIGYKIIVNWDILESWITVFTLLIPPTFIYFCFIIISKKVKLSNIFKRLEDSILNKYISKLSLKRNFDIKEIEEKEKELLELNI